MANEFIARRGLIVLTNGAKITGSLEISGSVSSSAGFSGSGTNIFGVVSSSYATTSSLALNNITNASVSTNILTFTKGDGTTFNVTISQSGSVESASFATNSATASFVEYNNVANKPALISSSTQFTSLSAPFTGSFTGSFTGDGSGLTGIASTLGISGSTGTDTVNLKTEALTITGSNGITTTVTDNRVAINLPLGTVTASSQVDHDATTNFVANEHIDHSTVSISTGGGLTGGGDITATRTLTLDTGSVHFVSGAIANVLNPKGVFSSSAQVSYTGLSSIPSGIVSSSTQIPALLPNGTVSASSQVQHNSTTGYVANEHINHTTVSISTGNGLSGGGDISATRTLTLDTGSGHFVSGSRKSISAANTTGASGINTTYNNLTGGFSSSLVNSSVTVNGESISLGGSGTVTANTTNALTLGNGLTGTSFNGGAAVTATVDTGSTHFQNGVLTRINSAGVFSSSAQVQLSGITGTTFGAATYTFPQDLVVSGRLTAQEFYTELVSASVIYESGSTKFGDTADDRHSFTGTLEVTGSALIQNVLYTSGTNLDVDTGTEVIASVSSSLYDAAFFDYVVKKGANYRAGTVMSVWDGTNVEFTDTSTNDLGNTAEVLFSVDILSGLTRLKATVSTNDWIIKTAVRAL